LVDRFGPIRQFKRQTPVAATGMVHAEIVRWGEIIHANRIEATP